MPRRHLAAVAVAMACALLAGCTSDAGVNIETLNPSTSASVSAAGSASLPQSSAAQGSQPSGSSTPASSASTTPASASASRTAEGSDQLAAGEAADRASVKAQWIKHWDVLLAIGQTPKADREALAATVAIDPIKAKMLQAGSEFDKQGLETYGSLRHRIGWPQPIAGKATAVIDDCQDSSQTGSMKTDTGVKVTVGVPRDHYQGSLVKGSDGIWRVAQVFYLKDEPC